MAREPVLARIALAYLGFTMAEYATWMAILVYAFQRGGAGATGLVAVVQLVPSGLVAPFAAFAADRFRRDLVLAAGYLVQSVLLAATAAALYASAPWPIVVAAATATAMSFTQTRPTQAALLPSLTRTPEALSAANAVSGLAETLGIFVGPLLGGLLLFRSQPGDVFAVFAAIALLGVLLVARLPVATDGGRVGTPIARRAIARGAMEGFRVLRADRPALLVVIVASAMSVVLGALDVLFVTVAMGLLGAGESWAGYLSSAFGLGGVIGALATVALVGRRRLTPPVAMGGLVLGAPIAIIAVAPATAPLMFAVGGAGYSVATVASRTLLQRIAPDDVLARVFGILEGLGMFALALGSLGCAVLVEAIGIGPALVVTASFAPAVVALTWWRLSAIDRGAAAPDAATLALLRRLPIFAPLPAPAIERIMVDLVRLDLPAGQVLIREGQPGDRFYVIAEGILDVTRAGELVAERGHGEHVGEIALLRDVPRTATVTTRTAVRLFALDRGPFLAAVTGHPQSRERADAVVAERL